MILSNSDILPRITALVIVSLCLSNIGFSASEASLTDYDKDQIARAVLQAELVRRREKFERVPLISTENIESLDLERVTEGFDMTLLGPQEIREKSGGLVPVDYILFKAITMENETAMVRLAVVREITPCFGSYREVETPFTYRVERVDNEWEARLIAIRAGFVFTNTNKTGELTFR